MTEGWRVSRDNNPGRRSQMSAAIESRLGRLALDDEEEDEVLEAADGATLDDAKLEADVMEADVREGDEGEEYSSIIYYADIEDEDDVDFRAADDNEDEDGGGAPPSPSRSPPRSRRRQGSGVGGMISNAVSAVIR